MPDQRASASSEKPDNVFDDKIRVGVAVYFLVRRQGPDGFRVFYNAIDDFLKIGCRQN